MQTFQPVTIRLEMNLFFSLGTIMLALGRIVMDSIKSYHIDDTSIQPFDDLFLDQFLHVRIDLTLILH